MVKSLFLYLILCSLTLNAQKIATIKGDSITHDLGTSVYTLYDTTGKLTFEQVKSATYQSRFLNQCTLEKNIKNHWYKIEIDNQTNKSLFHFYVYNIVHSEVFILRGNLLTHSTNGVVFPLKKRAYLPLGAVHPIQLGEGKTTIYILFKGLNEYPMYLGQRYFWLHDSQHIFYQNLQNIIIGWGVIAILFALTIYNFIIYLIVKDKSYLYYVISVGSLMFYFFLQTSSLYTWIEITSFEEKTWYMALGNLFGGFCVVFFILFSQVYLDTKVNYLKWHHYLQYLLYFVVISFLILIVSQFTSDVRDLNSGYIPLLVNNIVISIICITLLFLSIKAWKSTKKTGKYYAYANIFFLIATIIHVLENTQLYFLSFSSYHILSIAITAQMLVFSMALASRINLLKQEIVEKQLVQERLEKQKVQEIQEITERKNMELEEKVKERTRELQQSNEEIKAQSEILQIQKQEIEEKSKLLDDEKNRRLVNSTLQLIQKNETLNNISKQLESLCSLLPEENKKEAKIILKDIKQNTNIDEQWENFKKHFEQVHPDLFQKLLNLSPHLTTYDLRLCAYEKMGLNRKEVSLLLNMSAESVRKQHYRIKQKLGLAEDVSFMDFLKTV
jgi:hypothetical protein